MNCQPDFDQQHRQHAYRVRLEWGPVGAKAVGPVDIAVVVDVLSFTTTLTVAVERGIEVLPFRWRDDRAEAYAREHGAVLAVQRQDAVPGRPSLSPASLHRAEGVRRLVLPSPNGSTISTLLADGGATVLGASLRNRAAVAEWLAPRCAEGASVAFIASGERWPDGTLRPAVEDLWGAGAVLAALDCAGFAGDLSPEAAMARDAFRAADLPDALHACAGGRELTAKGYADDVEVASEMDGSSVVPLLCGRSFRAATDGLTDPR
ncbi:2-phosphosulfolactate phosphatase [Nocardioides sp. YR527]|uniref:2-phosphosulfolactate phosphatase n=1 Tax=Nocardioides sp. YR527 TaxID=1881028 RepID=UPI000889131D|nr:2-phosphosulfolactate phosphatase [Nocardioides sp. YR527]SDK80995.1 2-phosphosulfolactate phosphatase [Nocardioides sp. YR527]